MNKHKNKHIRAAVDYAIERGWRLEIRSPHAHAWGVLYCPLRSREGCQKAVYGTPRIPEAHAKDIRRTVDNCIHTSGEDL